MVTKKIHLTNIEEALKLFGSRDENLRKIEHQLGVQIFSKQSHAHGDFVISVRGPSGKVEKALKLINDFRTQTRTERESNQIIRVHEKHDAVITTHTHKHIHPRTAAQREYVDDISRYDVVIAIGPAGTGKTYLAVAAAVRALQAGKISKIILTRPIVEAGEKLGFLPGSFYEKVDPYLQPLYDAFYSIVGPEKFRSLKEDGIVEIIPLAYMRGRTLDDAFIILDEAQNTTSDQMKMFLTRLGFGSKAVVTGDITQIDLDKKQMSGLIIAKSVLAEIDEIKYVMFSEHDVVRHKIVKRIINAYENWESKKS